MFSSVRQYTDTAYTVYLTFNEIVQIQNNNEGFSFQNILCWVPMFFYLNVLLWYDT